MNIQPLFVRKNTAKPAWQHMSYAKWRAQFVKKLAKNAAVKKMQIILQGQLQLCEQQPYNDMARAQATQTQIGLINHAYQLAGLLAAPHVLVVCDAACAQVLKQPVHGRWVAANNAFMHHPDSHHAYLNSGQLAAEALASQYFAPVQPIQKLVTSKLNWRIWLSKHLPVHSHAYETT